MSKATSRERNPINKNGCKTKDELLGTEVCLCYKGENIPVTTTDNCSNAGTTTYIKNCAYDLSMLLWA